MKKVVLDKFGSAWGVVDGMESAERRISVATGGLTLDGKPVGREERKVSSNKKYFRELESNGNMTVFKRRHYDGCYSSFTFYTC